MDKPNMKTVNGVIANSTLLPSIEDQTLEFEHLIDISDSESDLNLDNSFHQISNSFESYQSASSSLLLENNKMLKISAAEHLTELDIRRIAKEKLNSSRLNDDVKKTIENQLPDIETSSQLKDINQSFIKMRNDVRKLHDIKINKLKNCMKQLSEVIDTPIIDKEGNRKVIKQLFRKKNINLIFKYY